MRLLVLGGTRPHSLSHHVARHAVERGHEVVCAARGHAGAPPPGTELVTVDRQDPGTLAPLGARGFDAVVDVATGASGWVDDALAAIEADHWTFVSSINVYRDTATPGQDVHAATHPPVHDREHLDVLDPRMTMERHAGTQVAGEDAVRDRYGTDRALLVRPGIISGPGDLMDRFGYWATRFARGGRAVVPDCPDQPVQHADVRDLAVWIAEAAERGLAGTYDAVGPVLSLGDVLEATARAVGATDLELVGLDPATLAARGVVPWGGPRSLPLWLPPDKHGLLAHDPVPAAAAGLGSRPLVDTVRTALADEASCGDPRSWAAGLTLDEEAAVLAGTSL